MRHATEPPRRSCIVAWRRQNEPVKIGAFLPEERQAFAMRREARAPPLHWKGNDTPSLFSRFSIAFSPHQRCHPTRPICVALTEKTATDREITSLRESKLKLTRSVFLIQRHTCARFMRLFFVCVLGAMSFVAVHAVAASHREPASQRRENAIALAIHVCRVHAVIE